MHLDVFVADLAGAAAKVEVLGARRLGGDGAATLIYADPAGHPFCLCRDDPGAP